MEQPPASVLELANSYPDALGHAQQVARVALWLFDALHPLHELGDEERWLLECGALLHDIGWVEGQQGHHKAAMRMILAAELPPFDARQQAIIALLARYHRKALPSKQHKGFAALDPAGRRRVCMLAGLLRVADGLDRTHTNAVHGLTCEITKHEIRISYVASEAADAERETAEEKADLLRDTFGRAVVVTKA